MYTIFIPTQLLLDRLRGAAVVAAFPVIAACSIWVGAFVVDQLQASAIHLAPQPVPQKSTCSGCSSASNETGAPKLQLPPWASLVAPSVPVPTIESP